MSRILFSTWPGGGNQPPAIGLAQQLRRAGHQALFAGYGVQAADFGERHLDLVTLSRSGTLSDDIHTDDLMPYIARRCWAAADHVADVAEVVERYQPDLLVVDCLMTGVLAAAETMAVPCAALVHSTPSALAPPQGPLDGLVLAELNGIRRTLDLDPVDSLWQAWRRHTVICASIPELDPLGTDAFPPDNWIGPVFEDTIGPPIPADTRPVILVSFSSGIAWDQTSRIQRTIDGLADADLRVIVTAGAVDPDRLRIPPSTSITVVPYLAHGTILPAASAVVTHAGHGTLTAALAHGLPIVALPNLAADQPALASRVADLGAGIALFDEPIPADIATAVHTVLTDPAYPAAARHLRDRIDDYRSRPLTVLEGMLTAARPA